MLRINEAPAIEVHIVQSSQPPGGMGECGTSAIVPAVANAIFAATGKRLRKMPVDAAALKERSAGVQSIGLFIVAYVIYGYQPQVGASADAVVAS
jgi:shikimate kinase